MRCLSTILITATLAAAPAMAAAAAPPAARPPAGKSARPGSPGESDGRCLLSMAMLSQDKQRQQAANIGVYFFAGRLSARGVDVQAAVREAETKMVPQQIPAELQRCGPLVEASMRSLQQTFGQKPGAQAPAAPGAASPVPAPAPAAPPPAGTPPAPAQPR